MPTGHPIPLITADAIEKSFGGIHALKGVSLALHPGEVHGLVGANGAGKSTLIRILAGLVQPDAGRITVDGAPAAIATPHDADRLGMNFIHQELAFIPRMTVLENIMLGLPKPGRLGLVDWRAAARDVAPIAGRVGITAPLTAPIASLSTAEKWLVTICRALVRKARLIVMDEPTASLSSAEAEKLFAIVEDLRSSGVAILYVSHRLDEIIRLCARVTAFRDGRSVAELPASALTRAALVEIIVGGGHVQRAARPAAVPRSADIVLSLRDVGRPPRVRHVTFDLHRGEVLGIGGLIGAGRTELARLVYGADRITTGSMTLAGRPFAPKAPHAAVEAGIGLVPEERRSEGLLLSKSVAFNLQLANLGRIVHGRSFPLIDSRRRASLSRATVRDLAIKTPGIDTPVGRLSGGNQQKVVIGRWLSRGPRVLILDEPTRGVDIGARAEIHRLIRHVALAGTSVLVISSEPEELPDLCDRVLVMAEGRLVAELEGHALTREAVIAASYAAAAGGQPGPPTGAAA